MKNWLIAIALAMLVGIAACSPLALINGASPSAHFTVQKDVAYGDVKRQTLDVYKPVKQASSAPLVMFFYGGGWNSGSKEKYAFVASALTKSGYTVVIPDYRLYPDAQFPLFLDDAAKAVAWTLHHAETHGADRDQVFIMGHSAGAYIAAMIALNADFLAQQGVDRMPFAGFIGLSGPYDFLPLQKGYLEDVFPATTRDSSQPIDFVTASAPPTLLIHGDDDDTVYLRNSEHLLAALNEAGVDASLKTYRGVGHARVVAALAPPLDFAANTSEDVLAFLDEHSSPSEPANGRKLSDRTEIAASE